MPVFETVLLGGQERLRGVTVLVEVLGEAALAAGKVDEGHLGVGLRVLEPVVLHAGVALQAQPLLDRIAGAGIVDQERESASIDGETSLLAGHVIGYAVLGLA